MISPRFLCRPTTLYIFARAVGRQSAIHTENSVMSKFLYLGSSQIINDTPPPKNNNKKKETF